MKLDFCEEFFYSQQSFDLKLLQLPPDETAGIYKHTINYSSSLKPDLLYVSALAAHRVKAESYASGLQCWEHLYPCVSTSVSLRQTAGH